MRRSRPDFGPDSSTGKWVSSFKDFPPRQKPASFSVDEVMKKLEESSRGR
jgi:arylsulfatase